MLARQHDSGQKRDDGGIGKPLAAYLRRAVEGTLSRPRVKTSVSLVASDTDSATILCDAASAYTVDINAIAVEGKQEFAAKVKTRKASQSTAKAGKKADWSTNAVTKCSDQMQ